MRRDVQTVRALLQGHDPAGELEKAHSIHRAALLQQILLLSQESETRSPQPNRPWYPAIGVVALAALAAVIAVVVPVRLPGRGATVAQAATPRLMIYQSEAGSAATLLQKLAQQVRTASDGQASSHAQYAYVKTQSWSLSTRVDGRQVRSAVVPEVRETWRAADGSGRLRIAAAAPEFPSQQYEQAWEAAGRPMVDLEDAVYGARRLALSYPFLVAEDVHGLRTQLAVGHPAENGPAETLVAVADLYREQTPNAHSRASVLDVVAAVPGLQLLGRTRDRAGRSGLAVAVDSVMTGLPTRFTLVFDERDGRLLDEEQVLTTRAGLLDVPIPSVISYTAFLSGGRVADVQTRP